MSTTIDSKVVEMRFDNQQFESGVKTSLGTLDRLKQSLKMDDTKKGLQDVGNSVNNIKFDGISNGLETVKAKFSAFQIAGITAIANLTNTVVDAGKKMANALITPIAEGGKRRAMNIAQAKFQFEGLGMDIEKAMEDANYAVADTAYGLDAAAKAAAMFGATGIQVGDEMKMSLRGISGVAAQTSSEYEDIANIFTTIAGNGRVMGENLNSLASRGVNAAAILGKALGKSEADIRKMVSKGEIDFRTFAKIMDDTFGEHAKEANKTFSGALSNIKAAMSKIGADIFTPLLDAMIGPLNSIRIFFNKVRKTITPFTTELGEQFHVLASIFDKTMATINNDNFEFTGLTSLVDKLTSFMHLGGLTNIIQGLANSFRALKTFIEPIKESFRNFFPESTALGVVKLTKAFAELTKFLIPSEATLEKVRKIFNGLFAALDIGRMAIHALFTPITYILQQFGIMGGKVAESAMSLSDWIIEMRESIIETQKFEKIANKITNILKIFTSGFNFALSQMKELISAFGGDTDLSGIDAIRSGIDSLYAKLRESTSIFDKIKIVITGFVTFVKNTISNLLNAFTKNIDSPVLNAIKNAFASLSDKLKESSGIIEKAKIVITSAVTTISDILSKIPFSLKDVLMTFADFISRIGLLIESSMILNTIKKLSKSLTTIKIQFNGAFFNSFKNLANNIGLAFKSLSSSLKALTQNIKVKTVQEIAKSVLILGGAMLVIASINPDHLAASLGSVTALLAEMIGSLALLSKIKDISNSVTKTATVLTTISFAVLLLAEAMKVISKIPMESLVNALLSVMDLLLSLTIVMYAMSSMDGKLVKGAAGLISLATAILILSAAMKVIATMNWKEIIKGLVVLDVLFFEINDFIKLSGGATKLISMGIGLMGVATALVILSAAMKIIATMSGGEIFKGLIAIGVALLELTVALNAMEFALPGAAALLVASASLIALGAALKIIGSMSVGEIAKSLIAIGIALVELTTGLNAMMFALPGAAALLVASAGLIALGAALRIIGSMTVEQIAKGLITVAAAIGIIGAAGIGLVLAIPGILALSVGFVALSASVLLLGVGLTAIGTGLTVLQSALVLFSATAPAVVESAINSIKLYLSGLLTILPDLAISFGKALIELAKVIGEGAPIIGDAIAKLIIAVCDAIIKASPKIIDALGVLFQNLVKSLRQNASVFVEEFVGLIQDVLNTFAKYTPNIIQAGKSILLALIEGIGSAVPELVDAGFKAMIAFINGIADAIEDNIPVLRQSIDRLVSVIISALTGGLASSKLINGMIDAGKNAVRGFINGISSGVKLVVDKAKELGSAFIHGLNSKEGLDEHSPSVKTFESGVNAGEGLLDGTESMLPKVEKMGELLGSSLYSGSSEAAEEGGNKLQSTVDENNGNILSMFSNYLSKLNVLKQEESDILSQKPRQYTIGEEQAVLNTITNMRAKYNRNQKAEQEKAAKNEEAYQKTLTNMRNKAAKQEGKTTATALALRKANVESKQEEVKEITKAETTLAETTSKSTGSTKKAAEEKKKVYAEMTADEKAYWTNVLEMHKQGAESEKYIDMDLLEFQESVVEDAEKLVDDYMKKYESTVDSLMAKGSIFDAVKEQDAVAKEDLQKNLQDQINQLNEFGSVMASLDQRLAGTNLQGAIQEMSISSLAELKALNSMTDTELQGYVQLYDTKYAAAQQAAIGQLGGLQRETEAKLSQMMGGVSVNLHSFIKDFDGTFASIKNYANKAVSMGADITAGIGKGISENTKDVKAAAVAVVDDKTGLTRSIKDELDIHSPSGVMEREVGAQIDNGINDGMDKNSSGMRITARLMILRLIDSIKAYVPQFNDVGVNIGLGIIEGLKSKENDLSIQAAAMAKAALDSAKSTLRIASPSKEFYKVGKFAGQGFVNALKDSSEDSANEGANMALTTLERVSEILDSGIDINPVITPVLDLSSIESGSKRLNGITNSLNDVSIGVSGNLAANTANRFNSARAANLAENQNGLDLLKSAINALSNRDQSMTQNNTFNISGDDPRAIADEISRVLQMQVERRGAIWA